MNYWSRVSSVLSITISTACYWACSNISILFYFSISMSVLSRISLLFKVYFGFPESLSEILICIDLNNYLGLDCIDDISGICFIFFNDMKL